MSVVVVARLAAPLELRDLVGAPTSRFGQLLGCKAGWYGKPLGWSKVWTGWAVNVCDLLEDLRRASIRFAKHFDPQVLSCDDAARVVKEICVLQGAMETVKGLAAARMAEAGDWRRRGHRSAAEALAQETGTSVTAAREIIDTGRRLASQPEVRRAGVGGELSFSQVSLIANAVEADPKAAPHLVERAKRSSLSSLKDECALTKAQAQPDLEARRRSIHSRRYLRTWTDVEGMWHLVAAGNPEDGAQVMARIEAVRDSLFKEARAEGRWESPDSYSFDALVRLASESWSVSRERHGSDGKPSTKDRTRCGAPVKLLVRVDYETLLRGFPVGSEVCEIAGFGPVSVSAVNELLEIGDPFVAAVLTKGKALVGVAHLGRQATAHQRSALEWLYPSCAVHGCSARAHLEVDHTIDWSKTHFTMLDHLKFLCHHHHYLKTNERWAFVQDSGKCLLVGPDDPRHPTQATTRQQGRSASSGPRGPEVEPVSRVRRSERSGHPLVRPATARSYTSKPRPSTGTGKTSRGSPSRGSPSPGLPSP